MDLSRICIFIPRLPCFTDIGHGIFRDCLILRLPLFIIRYILLFVCFLRSRPEQQSTTRLDFDCHSSFFLLFEVMLFEKSIIRSITDLPYCFIFFDCVFQITDILLCDLVRREASRFIYCRLSFRMYSWLHFSWGRPNA